MERFFIPLIFLLVLFGTVLGSDGSVPKKIASIHRNDKALDTTSKSKAIVRPNHYENYLNSLEKINSMQEVKAGPRSSLSSASSRSRHSEGPFSGIKLAPNKPSYVQESIEVVVADEMSIVPMIPLAVSGSIQFSYDKRKFDMFQVTNPAMSGAVNTGKSYEEIYNAPLYDSSNNVIGLVSFFDYLVNRTGRVYVDEIATYFFHSDGSSVTYHYSFVSATGDSSFKEGSTITTLSYALNPGTTFTLGETLRIDIAVSQYIRTVTLTAGAVITASPTTSPTPMAVGKSNVSSGVTFGVFFSLFIVVLIYAYYKQKKGKDMSTNEFENSVEPDRVSVSNRGEV